MGSWVRSLPSWCPSVESSSPWRDALTIIDGALMAPSLRESSTERRSCVEEPTEECIARIFTPLLGNS